MCVYIYVYRCVCVCVEWITLLYIRNSHIKNQLYFNKIKNPAKINTALQVNYSWIKLILIYSNQDNEL